MPAASPPFNQSAYISQQIIDRFLRNAHTAQYNCAWDLPEMDVAIKPTLTFTTTQSSDTSLSFTGTSSQFNSFFFLSGGSRIVSNGRAYAYGVTQGTTGGNINNSGKTQNGYALVFNTTSDLVSIAVFGDVNPVGTNKCKFWLIIDNEYYSKIPVELDATAPVFGDPVFLLIDFTAVNTHSHQKHSIRFEVNNETDGNAHPFVRLSIRPTENIWAPSSDMTKVTLFGDSMGVGAVATYRSLGYGYLAAQRLGCTGFRAASIGSTGYQTTGGTLNLGGHLATDILTDTQDVVWILIGYNDYVTSQSTATLQATVLADLQAARAAAPYTPIVVFGLLAASSGPAQGILDRELLVQAAVTQFGDPFCKFVPVSTVALSSVKAWVYGTGYVGVPTSVGNSDWITSADAVHPGDAGHDDGISWRLVEGTKTALTQMIS